MSLSSCDNHNDVVVVYDDGGNYRKNCPLCDAIAADEETTKTIEAKDNEIESLKDEIATLN